MKNCLNCLIIIVYIICNALAIQAQQKTILTGTVYDKSNNSALPYSNLYLTGSKTGTISQNDGTFSLQLPKLPDTLKISAIGYDTRIIPLSYNYSKTLHIALTPSDFELSEIIIRPSENPALRIMRKVIANKNKNNPTKVKTLACNTYTKILFKTKGNVEGDSTLEKGLPIYFSEKLSQNILQRNPYYEKGKIISERQEGLGLFKEVNILGYANNLSIEFNFYDNIIDVFDKPFISPLSSSAFIFYNFHLVDSITTAFGKEYVIDFAPKNSYDPAFKGKMKVVDEDWYLSEITTKIPVTANLNYVNKIDLHQTFIQVNDSLSFLRVNDVNAELKITKDNSLTKIKFTGILNKRSVYSDILLNFPAIKPGEEEKIWSIINPVKSKAQNVNIISTLRPEELSNRELLAISTIDSMNNDWRIKTTDALTRMLTTGYFPSKYFEVGPYLELFKLNKVEGYRFNIAGRTSADLTKNIMLYGHVGYGTTDQEWKYGAGFKYKLPGQMRRIITLDYRNDMAKIGDNRSIFLIKENIMVTAEDNLLISFFTNKPLEQLSRTISYRAEYDHEWRTGVTSVLSFNHRNIYSGRYVPFFKGETPVNNIITNELSFRLRLSREEKYADNYCRRYYLNTNYPIIHLLLTGGQYKVSDVTDEYLTARAVVKHDISFGITKLFYVFESGITLGKVPFPLLETHRTDHSIGYALFSFNMMEEMEFASDRFISILAQYHLNGLIFNRVPLLKKIGAREVCSAKILWSHLGNNHQDILRFQRDYHDARIPYAELSVGIENIFQYFRVDCVWRLSQLQTPEVSNFGVRIRYDVGF